MATIPLRTEEVLEQQKTAGNNFVCPIHRNPLSIPDGQMLRCPTPGCNVSEYANASPFTSYYSPISQLGPKAKPQDAHCNSCDGSCDGIRNTGHCGGCDGRTECEGPKPKMQLALPAAIAGTKLAQLIEEDQNRFVVPTTWE